MSGSVNKVILIGNLGRDPEVRTMQDGGKVVNLAIATSESWKDKNTGLRQEKTEWHRVSIFNERLADVAQKYLRKGSKVYLEGALQTRKWTDQSGTEKYTTEIVLQRYRGEIVMLDGAQSLPETNTDPLPETNTDPLPETTGGGAALDDGPDSEIPF